MILANVIGCHKNFCQDEFRTRFREIKTLIGLFSNAVSITSRFHCVSGHWGHALLSSSSHIFFFSLLHLLLSSMSSSTSPATPPSLHVFTCSLWPVSPVTGPLFFSPSRRLHLHFHAISTSLSSPDLLPNADTIVWNVPCSFYFQPVWNVIYVRSHSFCRKILRNLLCYFYSQPVWNIISDLTPYA